MSGFVIGPSVVASFAKDIPLFPSVLADIADPDLTGLPIDTESPGMTKADGVKLAAQCVRVDWRAVKVRHAKERIIRRDTVERVPAARSEERRVGKECRS